MGIKDSNTSMMPGANNNADMAGSTGIHPLPQISRGDLSSSNHKTHI